MYPEREGFIFYTQKTKFIDLRKRHLHVSQNKQLNRKIRKIFAADKICDLHGFKQLVKQCDRCRTPNSVILKFPVDLN